MVRALSIDRGAVMVQREERIADFVTDRLPDAGAKVQILCEDHVGTYTLPFLCSWTEGNGWISATTRQGVDAAILGWREHPAGGSGERPMWASRRPTGV